MLAYIQLVELAFPLEADGRLSEKLGFRLDQPRHVPLGQIGRVGHDAVAQTAAGQLDGGGLVGGHIDAQSLDPAVAHEVAELGLVAGDAALHRGGEQLAG